MNIIQIYKKFPTQDACIKHLEQVRWNGAPACPYCKSLNNTPVLKEQRHHCNTCNTSFKVTVGTIFHNTKLDLQKWFLGISLVLNAKKGIAARQLARDLEVTKDTAWSMIMRIRKAFAEQPQLMEGLVEVDETYVGGKEKNKHEDKRQDGTQGRSLKSKTAVFGMLQRDGKVKAQVVKDVKGKTLKQVISDNVEVSATIIGDEWVAYRGLALKFKHYFVEHGKGQYQKTDEATGLSAHTNTLEGFWSMLKRGIIGQYHWISPKHLNKYIAEFCFRYNNRSNDNIWDLAILKAVSI